MARHVCPKRVREGGRGGYFGWVSCLIWAVIAWVVCESVVGGWWVRRWVRCSSGSRKHVFDVAGGCVEQGGVGFWWAGGFVEQGVWAYGGAGCGLWVTTGHGGDRLTVQFRSSQMWFGRGCRISMGCGCGYILQKKQYPVGLFRTKAFGFE